MKDITYTVQHMYQTLEIFGAHLHMQFNLRYLYISMAYTCTCTVDFILCKKYSTCSVRTYVHTTYTLVRCRASFGASLSGHE